MREHEVEDDQVDLLLREPRQRLLAVPGMDDVEAVPLERVREQLLHGVLVVDEEDGRGIRHVRMLETAADSPTLAGPWRRPDERFRRVRGLAAAPSSVRSTRASSAGPGCSWRCR